MKISVTAEDIQLGLKHTHGCPIEVACNRAYGGSWRCGYNYLFNSATGGAALVLPPSAREFVQSFGILNKPVAPLTFEVSQLKVI